MASSISFVSSPSIVKIISFVKSVRPIKSASLTSSGIFLSSSLTASLNSVSILCLAAIVKISTPGSFLCPIIFSTLAKNVLFPISFKISIITLWPSTQPFKLSLVSLTAIFSFSSSGLKPKVFLSLTISPTTFFKSLFNIFLM